MRQASSCGRVQAPGPRQLPEVSDFVTRFCTLWQVVLVKKNTDMRETHAFRVRLLHVSVFFLALLAQIQVLQNSGSSMFM